MIGLNSDFWLSLQNLITDLREKIGIHHEKQWKMICTSSIFIDSTFDSCSLKISNKYWFSTLILFKSSYMMYTNKNLKTLTKLNLLSTQQFVKNQEHKIDTRVQNVIRINFKHRNYMWCHLNKETCKKCDIYAQ